VSVDDTNERGTASDDGRVRSEFTVGTGTDFSLSRSPDGARKDFAGIS